MTTKKININNGSGTAKINLKAVGERQTVNASVDLVYRNGQPWRVTAASYQNDKGQNIELLDPYQGRIILPKLSLKVAA